MPKDVWSHFVILSIAIRILCSVEFSANGALLDYAESLMKKFVEDFKQIYEGVSIVYNVHSLLHLAEDARRLGALDTFSAFPFENFLGIMKRRIRSGSQPLAQICRRLSEMKTNTFLQKSSISNRKITKIQTLSIIIGDFKNSCVLLKDDSIGIIIKQTGNKVVLNKFVDKTPLLRKPLNTCFLNLFKVTKRTKHISINQENIASKCFICPYMGGFAVIPLL